MSKDSGVLIVGIFDQLRILRERVSELEQVEEQAVTALRGHQTMDPDEAVQLSFVKLQQQIADMEETLATIAEATGDIPKL